MAFTVKEFLAARAAAGAARRRRVVPEPPRGRRQPPPRREGDPASVRRRPARRLRDQPRPLGRHRRRRAGLLRAVGERGQPGGAPDRADQGLRPGGPTRAFDLIMANVRGREEREGDCRAMFAAVEVGARRLGELFRRYGARRSSPASSAIAPSEPQMRRRPPQDPRRRLHRRGLGGRRRPRGRPVPIRVTVTVRGDRATFDFTGTGATVKGPINTTPSWRPPPSTTA